MKNKAEAHALTHLYNLWLVSMSTRDQFDLEIIKMLDVILPNCVQFLNINSCGEEIRAQRLINFFSKLSFTKKALIVL